MLRWKVWQGGVGRSSCEVYLPLLASVSECLVLHPQACRIEVDRLRDVFACEDDVVEGFDGERRHFGAKVIRCTSLPDVIGNGR